MSAIGSIVSGVATFVIAFVFACYVLLQKEKLRVQVTKVLYAIPAGKTCGVVPGSVHADCKVIFKLPDRPVC